MDTSRQETSNRIIPILVFGVTALVYFPVLRWIMGQTIAHEQLTHAFIVFLLTGLLLATRRELTFRPVWTFTETCQNLLILSYIILGAAIYADWNILILLSLALFFSAFMLFVFGRQRRRFVFSSTGAFAIFSVLAAILPALDWPLRTIAGKVSAIGLNLIGHEAKLGIFADGNEPMLILLNNGTPFNVAAECNGFGMVSSCLLMTMIIVFYRRFPWVGKLVRLLVALLMALVFNSIRIITIVIVASHIPSERYLIMHEIVGTITTYGGLAILYLLLNRGSLPESAPAN